MEPYTMEFYQTPEFQSWRNGIYGLYETALFQSYKERQRELFDWNAPDILFLSLRNNIMKAYSSSKEIDDLIRIYDGAELILPDEFDNLFKEATKSQSDVLRSLVYERLTGWHRIAIWSCIAAYHGSYESVAREMRFVLEDSLQAYYANQQRPNDNLNEKIKWIENNQKRGRVLIDATSLSSELKDKLKQLYYELCDYVHPSTDLIRRNLDEKGRLYAIYIPDWYEQTKEFHRRTFDLVFTIVALRFPNAAVLFFLEKGTQEMFNEHGFTEISDVCKVLYESHQNP